MMTAERLSEISARCEAATPGPWAEDDKSRADLYRYVVCDSLTHVVCRISRLDAAGANRWCDADLAFIAHARQDIPDLLAEVQRLQAENESLHRQLNADQAEDGDA